MTRTIDIESNPQFTQDESRVMFTRASNLYTVSLETGAVEQAK